MKKKIKIMFVISILIFAMAGCGRYAIDDEKSLQSSVNGENPFDELNNGLLASITHGESNPNRDDFGNVLPYEYNGGEFSFEYYFQTEGKLDNVGFLLFLDGEPQPYKINTVDAKYEYCHYFEADDGKEEKFTFSFLPHTGNSGDTLNLTIVSITNPEFKPDMKSTSSYGWYHKHLERVLKLHFNQDATMDNSGYPDVDSIFTNVSVEEEKVTSSYLENEIGKDGWGDISIDSLNTGVYSTLLYDGELVYDNVDVSGKDILTVRYTLCGMHGLEYKITFFLDHQPISYENTISYDVVLHKGNVWVVEATIDTSRLENFNTFYVMAVATGDSCDVGINKRDSILLYKEIIK